ncbi:hypothetical protein PENTCL1PPCAC_15239, partial [Pristionchus entomophagus]
DLFHVCIVSALDLAAILVNSIFIFVILRKTPPDLSNYSVLLINIACADLFNALCSFMCIVRVRNAAGCFLLSYIGPCTLYNAQLCHLFFAGHCGAACQSIQLLGISFAYRYWSLKPKIQNMHAISRRLWIATGISMVPLTLMMVIICVG